MSEPLVIAPYDSAWPQCFETERELLERVLVPWLDGGVHHVGSTAVPGLAAKPIVDMIAGVRDLDEARSAFGPLLDEGYASTPHRPGIAHHFSKLSPRSSELGYGLHLTEPGSDLWRERLAFREALRADPSIVREYEALKVRLAADHTTDIAAYTAGKRAFVASVLARDGIPLGRR